MNGFATICDLLIMRQYLLDLSMAVAGLLMFGDGIRDEVTSNILMTKGYPKSVSILMVICVAIIPVTKIPLKYCCLWASPIGFDYR